MAIVCNRNYDENYHSIEDANIAGINKRLREINKELKELHEGFSKHVSVTEKVWNRLEEVMNYLRAK